MWWLRLGIDIERIKPGHRQQNGRHERMHLTLKKEATRHDRTIIVTRCGRICLGGRKINLSAAFAGQNVGIREISEKIWLVSNGPEI